MNKNSFLTHVPPMGIYETLYAFQNSFGSYMGEKGTHPWSQGFPLTSQIPGGPEMPNSIKVNSDDLKYPKAWGQPELRQTIAEYYNHHYGSSIDLENVMIFAGGRPGLIALLMFLQPDIKTHIASTEYTPYYDMLRLMNRKYHLIDSTIDNNFHPSVNEYLAGESNQRKLVLLSNPCNPTGITRMGDELKELVERSSYDVNGLLIDEAYELFHSPPISAMQFMDDINNSNLFVAGAATKGLQAPGIRIGWVVAAKKYIEILGNFSSFGMGGVSRPSQLYALKLFDKERIELSRKAVPKFYDSQRNRYGKRFKELGLELYSGNGGFYHWCKLKGNLTGTELNEKLFKEGAAILKGTDCDMYRLEENSHLKQFFRFSFGPLLTDSYESDIEILNNVLNK
jgi:aspartate/methionine/tyrosine aminotransferase